jgi:hypothetical protein
VTNFTAGYSYRMLAFRVNVLPLNGCHNWSLQGTLHENSPASTRKRDGARNQRSSPHSGKVKPLKAATYAEVYPEERNLKYRKFEARH